MPAVREACSLSTCNRVEVFAVADARTPPMTCCAN